MESSTTERLDSPSAVKPSARPAWHDETNPATAEHSAAQKPSDTMLATTTGRVRSESEGSGLLFECSFSGALDDAVAAVVELADADPCTLSPALGDAERGPEPSAADSRWSPDDDVARALELITQATSQINFAAQELRDEGNYSQWGPHLRDHLETLGPSLLLGQICFDVTAEDERGDWILPEEALLALEGHHEPDDEPEERQVFMNIPVSDEEQRDIEAVMQMLLDVPPQKEQRESQGAEADAGAAAAKAPAPALQGVQPLWLEQLILRYLYSCAFDYQKTFELLQSTYAFRTQHLPVKESEVFSVLQNVGACYWHGRDRKLRPLLVVSLQRLQQLQREPGTEEKVTRVVVFCLEFFLRYLCVAGVVETWCILCDLSGTSLSSFPLPLLLRLLQLLQGAYRGRLYRFYLLYAPRLFHFIARPLLASLPSSTARKLRVYSQLEEWLEERQRQFSAHQIEQKFGGTAPDVTDNWYPFRFFPGPFDPAVADDLSTEREGAAEAASAAPNSIRWESDRLLHTQVHPLVHTGACLHTSLLQKQTESDVSPSQRSSSVEVQARRGGPAAETAEPGTFRYAAWLHALPDLSLTPSAMQWARESLRGPLQQHHAGLVAHLQRQHPADEAQPADAGGYEAFRSSPTSGSGTDTNSDSVIAATTGAPSLPRLEGQRSSWDSGTPNPVTPQVALEGLSEAPTTVDGNVSAPPSAAPSAVQSPLRHEHPFTDSSDSQSATQPPPARVSRNASDELLARRDFESYVGESAELTNRPVYEAGERGYSSSELPPPTPVPRTASAAAAASKECCAQAAELDASASDTQTAGASGARSHGASTSSSWGPLGREAGPDDGGQKSSTLAFDQIETPLRHLRECPLSPAGVHPSSVTCRDPGSRTPFSGIPHTDTGAVTAAVCTRSEGSAAGDPTTCRRMNSPCSTERTRSQQFAGRRFLESKVGECGGHSHAAERAEAFIRRAGVRGVSTAESGPLQLDAGSLCIGAVLQHPESSCEHSPAEGCSLIGAAATRDAEAAESGARNSAPWQSAPKCIASPGGSWQASWSPSTAERGVPVSEPHGSSGASPRRVSTAGDGFANRGFLESDECAACPRTPETQEGVKRPVGMRSSPMVHAEPVLLSPASSPRLFGPVGGPDSSKHCVESTAASSALSQEQRCPAAAARCRTTTSVCWVERSVKAAYDAGLPRLRKAVRSLRPSVLGKGRCGREYPADGCEARKPSNHLLAGQRTAPDGLMRGHSERELRQAIRQRHYRKGKGLRQRLIQCLIRRKEPASLPAAHGSPKPLPKRWSYRPLRMDGSACGSDCGRASSIDAPELVRSAPASCVLLTGLPLGTRRAVTGTQRFQNRRRRLWLRRLLSDHVRRATSALARRIYLSARGK